MGDIKYVEKYQFKKGGKRAAELGKKGGQAITDKKKFAHRLRGMKQRGATNKDIDWLLEKLNDPKAFDLDMVAYVESIKDNIHPMHKIAYGNLLTQVRKTVHGEKKINQNLNINVDWNDIIKDCEIEEDDNK